MTCPACGRAIPREAAYCPNCGAALDAGVTGDPPEETEPIPPSGAPPPTPPLPPPSGRRRAWNPLAAWPTALVRAGVAFGVVVAVILLNAIVVRQLAGSAVEELPLPPGLELDVPLEETIRTGLLQFHAAHAVPLVGEVRELGLEWFRDLPTEVRIEASLTFAPMLFTALAGVLLFRGGRAVARRTGGGALSRGLSGATVAAPYALLSLVLSLAVSSSSRFEYDSIDIDLKVHANHVAAFLWPLAVGAVAGFLGGVATAREELAGRRPWGSRAWSALAGGWRMLAVGLLGSFLGLQVVAFAESDLPVPYGPGFFETLFEGSPSSGLAFTDQTATYLPNMAVWVLVPSLGACDGLDADVVFRLDVDVICYASFPGPGVADALQPEADGFPEVPDLPAAPPIYLLFLLVPVVATVYGGWTAGRRSGSPRTSEGALAGAGAGVVFALGVLALAVMSRATLGVAGSGGGFSGEGGLSAGADPVLGTLLALAWGLAGGAVGGLLGARSLPPEAREPVAAASTSPAPAGGPGGTPGWPWAGPPPPGDEPTSS
jgi:hypothetical protein